ncbi:hypothetical protein [Symbiopectobacterium purcellii]|uniref:hypothetical protein n=1 Tax=Symbiopectobacterium purcellii TaxID=2871826 RepID=UPI003F83DFA5
MKFYNAYINQYLKLFNKAIEGISIVAGRDPVFSGVMCHCGLLFFGVGLRGQAAMKTEPICKKLLTSRTVYQAYTQIGFPAALFSDSSRKRTLCLPFCALDNRQHTACHDKTRIAPGGVK